MESVNTNIRDLEEFRAVLNASTLAVHATRQNLSAFVNRLSEDWKDHEYDRFHDAFLKAESTLGQFVDSAEVYKTHLQTLINPIAEYLRTTVPTNTVALSAYPGAAESPDTRHDIQTAVATLNLIVPALCFAWPSLTPAERLGRLQDLQGQLAATQSRGRVRVTSSPMNQSLFGEYNGQQIRVNQNHLDDPTKFWQILDTLIHEDRHAYQHWSVNTPGYHNDEAEVRAWSENLKQYRDPTEVSFRMYRDQPVERDAFSFAEMVVSKISGRGSVG